MHVGKETQMEPINWKRKLSSRKFWLSVAAFVVGCLTLFNVDAGTVEKIGALILLGADVVGYCIAEGLTDAGTNITL